MHFNWQVYYVDVSRNFIMIIWHFKLILLAQIDKFYIIQHNLNYLE